MVDVYIRHNSPGKGGQVVLSVGQEKFTAQLSGGSEFGDERAQLALPEFASGTKAEVAVTLGGHHKTFRVELEPAKKWTVFVVAHTHLDVGYSDYQAKVAEAQSRTLDEAIQMIHDHPDFRFGRTATGAYASSWRAATRRSRKSFLTWSRRRRFSCPRSRRIC